MAPSQSNWDFLSFLEDHLGFDRCCQTEPAIIERCAPTDTIYHVTRAAEGAMYDSFRGEKTVSTFTFSNHTDVAVRVLMSERLGTELIQRAERTLRPYEVEVIVTSSSQQIFVLAAFCQDGSRWKFVHWNQVFTAGADIHFTEGQLDDPALPYVAAKTLQEAIVERRVLAGCDLPVGLAVTKRVLLHDSNSVQTRSYSMPLVPPRHGLSLPSKSFYAFRPTESVATSSTASGSDGDGEGYGTSRPKAADDDEVGAFEVWSKKLQCFLPAKLLIVALDATWDKNASRMVPPGSFQFQLVLPNGARPTKWVTADEMPKETRRIS